jgi:hypothetical protein
MIRLRRRLFRASAVLSVFALWMLAIDCTVGQIVAATLLLGVLGLLANLQLREDRFTIEAHRRSMQAMRDR